jgi:hypothetical protein
MTVFVLTRPSMAASASATTCFVPAGTLSPLALSGAPFSGCAARDISVIANVGIGIHIVQRFTNGVPR